MRQIQSRAATFIYLLTAAGPLFLLRAEASAAIRDPHTVILSEKPQIRQVEQEWGFADAVTSGDTVYLSGVVAGLRPGETDLQAAYDRAFNSIGDILKRAGSSWDDVIEMTTYHTDLKSQMPAIVAAKRKYVTGLPPAWTAVQVVRLIPDAGLTEIRVVARRQVTKGRGTE